MNSLLLPLLTALLIGLLVGMLSMWDGPSAPVGGAAADLAEPTAAVADETASGAASDTNQRLQELERKLHMLNQRLAKLEHSVESSNDAASTSADDIDVSESPEQDEDPLNQQNLVRAGVSAELASDIMRRLGEQEYQRLALRDRAIREGYFRSGRYFRELRELRQNQLSLRDEIGDPAYDRYLYESGQNNRVAVASVMSGSPADQTGMQQGDILLRYNSKHVFSWNEVRQATSKGELGEYVTVDVMRDGQVLSLMLPRGPLGVKLDTTRVAPGDSP